MALTQAELEALARKPLTVTSDAGSVTQRSGDDVRTLAELAADATLEDPNPQGGRKSAWRQTRPARSIPPGAL